ncbi:hypothetical protein Q7A53_05775 [Halobacillus rhizosphaerae]|uniref:hypothetical protein n=1 Tax=Halobacillus rhizosphaerae TaxID=3064889 RepID=UPI00398B3CCD
MNIEILEEKVQKAQEQVNKKKKTIERHEKALEKKNIKVAKQGITLDLSSIDAVENIQMEHRQTDLYWDISEVKGKLEDIRGARGKLKKAEDTLANWQSKLDVEIDKEKFLQDQAPQVIKDFLENWKELAYKWHIKRYNDYLEMRKDLEDKADKLKEEIGVRKNFFPNKEQEAILKEHELDYQTIKGKLTYFAGGTVLRMATIYDEEKRLTWLNKLLEDDKKFKMLDLIRRINGKIGLITDASNLSISRDGNLNGIIIGEKGKARVETIGAGGYNIQCFHFRTLVKEIK